MHFVYQVYNWCIYLIEFFYAAIELFSYFYTNLHKISNHDNVWGFCPPQNRISQNFLTLIAARELKKGVFTKIKKKSTSTRTRRLKIGDEVFNGIDVINSNDLTLTCILTAWSWSGWNKELQFHFNVVSCLLSPCKRSTRKFKT